MTWTDWRLNFPKKNESHVEENGNHEGDVKENGEGEGDVKENGDREGDVKENGDEGETAGEPEEEEIITINVHPVILEELWLPDPYFFNVRSVRTVNILKQVQGVLFSSDKSLFISTV